MTNRRLGDFDSRVKAATGFKRTVSSLLLQRKFPIRQFGKSKTTKSPLLLKLTNVPLLLRDVEFSIFVSVGSALPLPEHQSCPCRNGASRLVQTQGVLVQTLRARGPHLGIQRRVDDFVLVLHLQHLRSKTLFTSLSHTKCLYVVWQKSAGRGGLWLPSLSLSLTISSHNLA